jgi:hypothetical protein
MVATSAEGAPATMSRWAAAAVAPLLLALTAPISLAGCANVLGLSGYENGDELDANVPDGSTDGAAESAATDSVPQDSTLTDSVEFDAEETGTLDSAATDTIASDTTIPEAATSDSAGETGIADTKADTLTPDSGAVGPDSAVDTGADAGFDTTVSDTALPDVVDAASDSADSLVAVDVSEVGTDAADAGPCATVRNVGLSEIMIRTISGTGDTHEWFELTNYDAACTFDVGGMRVTTQSWSTTSMTFIAKANVTIPAGVKLAPGASLVFADLKSTFLTDAAGYFTTYGLDSSLVIDLNWTFGDLFVNGYDNKVDIYYPGATTPSEGATISARGTVWPTVGRSFEFPSICDPTLRLLAGSPATTSTHWVDTTAVAAEQYGNVAANSIYGTPGRKNDLPTTCP